MSSAPPSTVPRAVWHSNYPAAKSTPAVCTQDVLKELIEESAGDEDTGFVIVDVRGQDFQGSCIKGAINIPAKSFYPAISTLGKVFADRSIIFCCYEGDGTDLRCAAWYQDYQSNLPGDAAVLHGGVKEWVMQYSSNHDLVTKLPDMN